MKFCTRCGQNRAASEFQRNRSRPDGLQDYCKPCTKAVSRAWREANRDKLREIKNTQQKRAYARDPTKHQARSLEWDKHHRVAKRAHNAVRRALKSGRLVRPTSCERCGVSCTPHAHHADYAQPLNVEWLCTTCHGKEHRQL